MTIRVEKDTISWVCWIPLTLMCSGGNKAGKWLFLVCPQLFGKLISLCCIFLCFSKRVEKDPSKFSILKLLQPDHKLYGVGLLSAFLNSDTQKMWRCQGNIQINYYDSLIAYLLFVYLSFLAGDGTRGLTCMRSMVYHWGMPSAQFLIFSIKININRCSNILFLHISESRCTPPWYLLHPC